MSEVAVNGVRRWKTSFVVAMTLVGILTISNLWLYAYSNNLQIQVGNLQTLVEDTQTEGDYLLIKNTDLQNQLNVLDTKYRNYKSTHSYTDSAYENYVANHKYTNSEYDEAWYSFYYVKPEGQKFGVYNLDDELDSLQWTEPYQAGVFDCSEMSACLEWFLENRGWHVKIYRGDSPFSSGTHAWLIVETSQGKYMPVESTNLQVVWWSNPNFDDYWEYENKFETIQDATDYSESQFDWWELGFCPLRD